MKLPESNDFQWGIFLDDFESSFLSFGVGFVFSKKHPPFYSVISGLLT